MINVSSALSVLAERLVPLIHTAGEAIMAIYQRDFDVEQKADNSPLTEADIAAHHIIVAGLKELSDFPVLSEESADIDWATRQQWQRYWLVDPLDGTKEFIKKKGEFTVNIALIDQGVPILGVVSAPALQQTYVGVAQQGAYKLHNGVKTSITPRPHQQGDIWRVVGSRSHQSPQIASLLQSLPGKTELVTMGSSLKLCLVAEGKAHLYPRLGPTSEWDTAAAQAIVEAAGGKVTIISNVAEPLATAVKPLRYNQKASILNPYFLVSY